MVLGSSPVAIIDILSENKIFVYPTIENTDCLLLQAAEITLLRVTYLQFWFRVWEISGKKSMKI